MVAALVADGDGSRPLVNIKGSRRAGISVGALDAQLGGLSVEPAARTGTPPHGAVQRPEERQLGGLHALASGTIPMSPWLHHFGRRNVVRAAHERRSIFRMSMGRCLRRRGRYPVPKSSIAIWNPESWRNQDVSRAQGRSCSRSGDLDRHVGGATPADLTLSSFAAKRADHSWRGDTLKPTLSSSPHPPTPATTASRERPSRRWRRSPISSASGMKSPGGSGERRRLDLGSAPHAEDAPSVNRRRADSAAPSSRPRRPCGVAWSDGAGASGLPDPSRTPPNRRDRSSSSDTSPRRRGSGATSRRPRRGGRRRCRATP